jgi:PAS domain-containing protein
MAYHGSSMSIVPSMWSFLSMIPHGHCYLWQPHLVRLHVISDALIGTAYYSIPITLSVFASKRRDVPFGGVFWLFAAFILACGTTHFMAIWTVWHPDYWVEGSAKAITALVSIWTAFTLTLTIQQALKLPRLLDIEQANQELRAEIESRKQTEIALKESEANFRNMAANVPGAIFRYILRPDGTDAVLYMSPSCYQLWEVEAHRVEQDASLLWQIIDPDDRPILRTSIMESAQTLDTWNCEWRITTASGHQKWLHAKGQPTRQPDGSILWHTVILDVSERARLEAERRAAEAALKVQKDFNELIAKITSRFVDLSPTDLDAEIERALQDIGEVTGIDTSYVFRLDDAEQTLSMSHEWCQPIYSQRIEAVQKVPFAEFPWSIATLKQRELIYAPRLADLPEVAAVDCDNWEKFDIEAILIIPLMQNSVVTGFMGFASFSQPIDWQDDIIRLLQVMSQTIANAQGRTRTQAALMESEARWHFALEGAGDGVWDWHVQTDTVFFSRQWKAMLGYEDHEIWPHPRGME